MSPLSVTSNTTQPEASSSPSGRGHMADEDLLALAVADRQAFAPLYARYLASIYRYCYRRLRTREAAEDATTQVFCRALSALASCGGSFRAWLFVIAHNVVVDMARHQRVDLPLEVAGDPADRAATPEEVALSREAEDSVAALLARLPADQRAVVELRLAGLRGSEIEVVMGRSRGAVKMLQHRALLRLGDFLTNVSAEAAEGGRE